MPKFIRTVILFLTLTALLVGCAVPPVPPTGVANSTPTQPAASTPEVKPTSVPTAAAGSRPAAVEYNLGETTITQSMFSEDSRFRNMPVRLNGIIAAPDKGRGPFPVVVILHGNHRGCPIPDGDMVDRWPCAPDVEQPNYRGFDYLVRDLAAQGYVALSLNINAENTFGFGEPVPNERLKQILDLQLKALAEANRGGENKFGTDLKGKVDLSRLAFIGHSQGGESAYWLTQDTPLGTPESSAKLGYGPVYGLLMVAPAANLGGAKETHVPLAVLLPACDGDVFQQDGQLCYEITRLGPQQTAWGTSVWLEQANHNYVNSLLPDERLERAGRLDCQNLLQPEAQRNFLSQ